MAWSPTPASPALCSASKAGEPARAGLETLQGRWPAVRRYRHSGLVIGVGDTVQRPTVTAQIRLAPGWLPVDERSSEKRA